MKYFFNLILIVALLSAVGCKERTEQGEKVDEHSAQHVLDWEGVYQGMIPCDDCPGIERTIYLSENGQYKLVDNYLEKENVEEKGSFQWSADGGSIELDNPAKSHFKVEEVALRMLDSHGKEITGVPEENYVLNKVDTSLIIKYRTVDYKYESKDGDQYEVVFGLQNDKPVARVSYEDKTYIYKQEKAWKGGGIYIYDGNSLSLNGETGEGVIDGKKIDLVLRSPLRYTYKAGGKELKVVYNNEVDTSFVVINYDGKRYVLPQVTAWAKGAEYATDKIKWVADAKNTIRFEMDGKVIEVEQ